MSACIIILSLQFESNSTSHAHFSYLACHLYLLERTGNDAFAGITRSSDSLRSYPITIFELIESTSLRSFYGMLALALEGMPRAPSIVSNTARDETDSDEEGSDEDEGPSHLSITLPCRRFHGSDARYNITVSCCLVHIFGIGILYYPIVTDVPACPHLFIRSSFA